MPLDGDIVSVLYGLAGLYTLYRLFVNRVSFFDQVVTDEDITLIYMVAIFLMIPLGVLFHEAGHYFTAKTLGATGVELHHRGYSGFVTYTPGLDFDSSKKLFVTAAGPLVSVLLAFSSMAVAVVLPTRMVFKRTLAFFGMVEGYHILIGYPLFDFFLAREGDFHNIYGSLPAFGIAVVGLMHVLLLALLVLSWKRPPTRELLSSY